MKRLYYLLLSLLPLSAWADDVTISTATEFREFAAKVNGGVNYEGTTVKLAADIDLGGVAGNADTYWTPIGTMTHPFQGTFDGQGHWISNLRADVEGSATGNVAGLFGCIASTATVKRVGVQSGNIHISSKAGGNNANCYVGGIVGLNHGRIEQCVNMADVVGNWNMADVGGIAGASGEIGGGATTATIENCYNQGQIISWKKEGETYFLGGIVGVNDGTVNGVYSNGTVSGVTFSGSIYATNSLGTISDAYSGGTLTGYALDGQLNSQGDYSVWTFTENELPQLSCFVPFDLELKNNADDIISTLETNVGKLCNVTLSGHKLYKDNCWNTLCLPFSLSSFVGTPLEGATVMSLNEASFDNGTLTLNFTTETAIEAGKPYIVKWEMDGDITELITNPAFSRVTISDVLTPSSPSSILTFQGNYSPKTLSANDRQKLYLGAANTLYYPSNDVTIGSFHAYFKLGDGLIAGEPATSSGNSASSSVKAFVLHLGEDETTGVEPLDLGQLDIHLSGCYSLDGKKTSSLHPGNLYIIDGKKVFIRK